jgi:chloride channel protein, CIC family
LLFKFPACLLTGVTSSLDKNGGSSERSNLLEDEAGIRQLAHRFTAIVISLFVGTVVGFAAVVFVKIVALAAHYWQVSIPHDLSFSVDAYSPAVGIALVVAALIAGQALRFINDGRPHGPADLIHAAQHERDPNLRSGFLSSLLALVNLSGGASVGIFGPLVSFGGCLSSLLQRHSTRLSRDVVLGTGGGAAIAAVFSAPIGAAIFAHEAIIRRFGGFGSAPVIACTFSAYLVSYLVLGEHPIFSVLSLPSLNLASVFAVIGVGVASGIASAIYMVAVTEAPKLATATRIVLPLRPLVPAIALFLLSPALPHLLGTGFGSIDLVMAGKFTLALLVTLVIVKIAITSLCLGFGFFGGSFGPALFFGAMIGGIFDTLISGQASGFPTYAVLGAASCVAAVIGAPLAAIVIMFELTGSFTWAVLSMISVVTATQISRSFAGRSLFDRQLKIRGVLVKDDYTASG